MRENKHEGGPDATTSGLHSVDPDVPDVTPPQRARREGRIHRAGRMLADRWDVLLVIAAGGAVGSAARLALGETMPASRGTFPWSTFLENVTGGLALGLLMVFVIEVWPPSRYLRPFLGVGVLGGYTTFSSYMLDTRELLVTGHAPLAGAYLFGTLIVGLAAVWAGITLGRLALTVARRRRRSERHDYDDETEERA